MLDDLAFEIHAYLLEMSVEFEGHHFVILPVGAIVSKFQRNHRTIQRRLSALRDEGLIVPLIKNSKCTLYNVREQEDQP